MRFKVAFYSPFQYMQQALFGMPDVSTTFDFSVYIGNSG